MAARVLRTLAWWAPEEIPRSYLDGLADPVTVTEGIRRLAAYSMITLRDDMISVHRLVQAMARASGEEERQRESDLAARTLGEVRLVGHAWGAAALGWAAHVEALASRAPAEADTEELASLFIKAALHLAALNPTRSAALYARSTAAIERLRGTDSAEASGLRLLTGLTHAWRGDFARAHPLIEKQLTQATQLFGEDHPTTFLMHCLTISVQARINPSGARARAEETVARVAQSLERNHPLIVRRLAQMSVLLPADVETGSAEARIADTVGRLGQNAWEVMPLARAWLTELESEIEFDRAAGLVEKMLDQCRSVLGSTDPATLALRLEQVSLLFYAGAGARARRLVPGLIADWAQYMGDTVNTWHLIEYLAPLLDETNE